MSMVPRLNRLFGADGKCFEVAMDHGVHNEPSFLPGIEDMKRAVSSVAAYGMPLMVESLVMFPNEQDGGYKPDPDIRKTVALVRQAVELGADIVKADPSENLQEYSTVIQAASPTPVLVRCGSRVSDKELLSRTHALMNQGASGTVYGRNVYQHRHIERIVRACMAIVHEGANASQAMGILGAD